MNSKTEPFPSLYPHEQLKPISASSNDAANKPKPRRKSSGLGGEIRAGDTGAPAFTTLNIRPPLPENAKAQIDRERKRPRKVKTLFQRWKRYSLKHTWVTPLILISVFLGLFAVHPTDSNPVKRFIFLSYKLPQPPGTPADTPPQYGKGPWDVAFVLFYTIVLSFTREFIMQNLLRPLAKNSGLKSRAKQSRFMEQLYTAIYFGCLGPVGMYVMSRTPVWYFNTRGMYEGFPHKTHEGIFKFYYLFQGAYWSQQALVLLLGMEKPRKDFKELVGHHIVSLSLIYLSYTYHFTYIGLAVYITHDISDFFLATSKVLNYLDHFLVGPYFGLFIFIWIYLRHYLNLRILYSMFNEFQTVGPYELNWETEQYKCWISNVVTAVLLSSLQSLNLFWLFYIFRIAYRFAWHNVAQDDRSDDDEAEYAEEMEQEKLITQSANGPAAPQLRLNGKLVEGQTTGAKPKTAEARSRKL
ncbi:MAG: hypothetical protein M1818_005668 [Claussenomyces sp. TS43310]|nr:MAG: hypothetical protein M1818_005668 [Claussenomyces sp. TS43310]